MDEIEELVQRLDQGRARIEALLPRVPPDKEIYPGWTIHQFLAHMTGWDDAVIACLRAHLGGKEPGTPAARGVDHFNAQTIETRDTIDLEKVRREWQVTRQILKDILRTMPAEKFHQEVILPWGGQASITQLVEIFIHHEVDEHGPDLEAWLKNPDQPLQGHA